MEPKAEVIRSLILKHTQVCHITCFLEYTPVLFPVMLTVICSLKLSVSFQDDAHLKDALVIPVWTPGAHFSKEVQPTRSLNLNSELTYSEMGNSEFSVTEQLNLVYSTLSRLTLS